MTDVKVISEPLTYHREGRHSYFRDLILTDSVPGAADRLSRHAKEMDTLAQERSDRSWREFRSGNFEYRVEPNTTQGTGGYFTPPAWLNELFATAKRPGRVLSGLAPHFPLPPGVVSVNLPIIQTGTTVGAQTPNSAVADQDITDASGSSLAVAFTGQEDVALQLLEQSPANAAMDWAIFQDLTEAYDYDLETQLLYGLGTSSQQLPGVVPAASTNVSFTSAGPTGALCWTALSQTAAQFADLRLLPHQCWLMRSARWAWIQGAESTSGYPFGMSPFFLGSDEATPDPIGGLMGWPVFLNDAISATLGAGANQDEVVCIRPADLIVFEGTPTTNVYREPGSGTLSARIQMHSYAAAITRHSSGIAICSGTGFVVQSGY